MDRIVNIETYKINPSTIKFAGTLRNQKKFELLQNVFILANGAMYQCKIIGIEVTLEENPSYIYKIEIPEGLVQKKEVVSLKCDEIFSTIEEAKASALEELEYNYELNKKNINKFFERFW